MKRHCFLLDLVVGFVLLISGAGASEITDALRNYSRACGYPSVLFEYWAIFPAPVGVLYLRPCFENTWDFIGEYTNYSYVAFYDPVDNNGHILTDEEDEMLRHMERPVLPIRVPFFPVNQRAAYVDSMSREIRGLSCNFASYDSLLPPIDSLYSGHLQFNVSVTIDEYTYNIDRLIIRPCPTTIYDSVFVNLLPLTYRFCHYADSVGWGYLSHHGDYFQPMWDSVRFLLVGCPEAVNSIQTRLPNAYSLSQNYPNPFNASTGISFELPQTGDVILQVFDLLGRKISAPIHQFMNRGRYSIQFNASNLPSGVYLYRLQSGHFSATRKMIVLK